MCTLIGKLLIALLVIACVSPILYQIYRQATKSLSNDGDLTQNSYNNVGENGDIDINYI